MRNYLSDLKTSYRDTKEEWDELPTRTRVGFVLFMGIAIMIGFTAFLQPFFLYNHHEYNTNISVLDAYNSSVTYNANIVMTTTIFAVDEPIDVKVAVEPNVDIHKRYVFVLFEGSHDVPPKKTGFADSLFSGKVDAIRQSSTFYTGNSTISYDMDGCFNVKITAYLPTQSTLHSNETRNCNFVHIQSSEAANADFYSKYLIILTIALMLLGSISGVTVFSDMTHEVNLAKERIQARKRIDP